MKLISLIPRSDIDQVYNLDKLYAQFDDLISELNGRQLPHEVVKVINHDIDQLNAISTSGKQLKSQIKLRQSKIVKLLEKELKLVTKGHYRNTWLALGMAVFGIPLGVAFGAINGNMGLLAIGLPLGMGIGLAVGSEMDRKAYNEGRQLEIELKY